MHPYAATDHYAAITTSRDLRCSIYAAERATLSISADATSAVFHFSPADLLALRGLVDGALAHLQVEAV